MNAALASVLIGVMLATAIAALLGPEAAAAVGAVSLAVVIRTQAPRWYRYGRAVELRELRQRIRERERATGIER